MSSGPSQHDVEAPPGFSRGEIVFLLGVTVLAAALRLFRLGDWSFWVDEAHTFRDITSDHDAFWSSRVARYPLSFVMLRGLLDFLPSTGEGWLRLPFAFFGILSVPTLALVGRELVGNRAALLAALLLALCPWHVYWSQNARFYTMMMFFGLLAAGGFYTGLRHRSILWFAVALIAAVLSGLTHPSGFLILAAITGVLLIETRTTLWRPGSPMRRWWPVVVLAGLAGFVIWLMPPLLQAMQVKPQTSLRHFLSTLIYFIGPPLILSSLGGIVWLSMRDRRAAVFLGLWAVLPLALLAFISVAVTKVTAQYGFCVLPAYCLATGAVFEAMSRAFSGPDLRMLALKWVLPAVLIGQLASYDYLYFTRQHGDRPRWREATAAITLATPEPKIVLTTNQPGVDYYLRRQVFSGVKVLDPEVVSIESWDIRRAGGGEPYMQLLLGRALEEERRLYVTLTEPELHEKDPGGGLIGWVRRNGHLMQRYPAWTGPKDMTVFVYEVPTVGANGR